MPWIYLTRKWPRCEFFARSILKREAAKNEDAARYDPYEIL